MMNKRGEEEESLTGNLAGLLIAVLVIAIIAGGGILAYYKITVTDEIEAAQGIADIIETGINDYSGEGSGFIDLQGTNKLKESNWFITAWSKNEENRPAKCFFESCIMICPALSFEETDINIHPDREKDCQEAGIARDITKYEKIQILSEETIAGNTNENSQFYTGPITTSYKHILVPKNRFRLALTEKTEEESKILVIALAQ